ncbi:HIT family protein [Candidatus Woesearchaeota archaeon]|nr:HIT family protein [Candidatus Woesearchaeota archaeon]
MKEDECLFCRLKNDKTIILKQTKSFYAIYDINPVSLGHCLLIAKRHVTYFFDLKEDEVLDYHNLLKELKKTLDDQFSVHGYNIGVNEGKAAGKTVDHLILHIIPRYNGDILNPAGGIRNILKHKS